MSEVLVKEILTILVGILGTIVGFYFGLSSDRQEQSLQFSPVILTDQTPQLSGKTTIITLLTGGTPPYTYSIIFDGDILPAITDMTSSDGSINQDVPIPSTAPNPQAATVVKFRIEAKDSRGKSGTYRDES